MVSKIINHPVVYNLQGEKIIINYKFEKEVKLNRWLINVEKRLVVIKAEFNRRFGVESDIKLLVDLDEYVKLQGGCIKDLLPQIDNYSIEVVNHEMVKKG